MPIGINPTLTLKSFFGVKVGLGATLDAISDAMKAGESLALIGFGTFSVTKKPARMGINPRTKEQIEIAAKNVVKFKAGSALNDLVK
ncbi:MAG: HU family DNA-binding protein [Bacteroidaceae bacterium]